MKKITTAIATAILLLTLTACHDPLFSEIRKEVEPTDATVLGRIFSITRNTEGEKEYLYIANSGIMRKDVTTIVPEADRWESFPKPDGADKVLFIAADKNSNLYAISFTFTEDVDSGEYVIKSRNLWCYKSGAWGGVELDVGGTLTLPTRAQVKDAKISLFSTNSPIKNNRRAFLNKMGTIYELVDGKATLIFNPSGKVTKDTDNKTIISDERYPTTDYTSDNKLTTYSRSAAWFNDKVIFNSNTADNEYNTPNIICTNEVAKNEERGHSDDVAATCVYYTSGNYLYCEYFATDDSTTLPTPVLKKTSAIPTTAIPISITATSNTLFIGTKEGLRKIALDKNGVPTGSVVSTFPTNAASTLSTSYQILMVFVVDSSKTELECEAYAAMDFKGSSASTSAQFKRIGLWSYYASRRNWNRE